jgi:hypothetical protein
MRRRRFPWLTAEDLALLAQLEEIDPEAARQFERLLDRQRRADARVRAHETTAADPVEVADERHARGRVGVGGGRRRPTELPLVRELPAEWIAPVVEDVAARYAAAWCLAGDDDQPIHDRLDAHFGARQEAKRLEVAAREARDVDEARRRRDADAELDRLAVEQTRALYGLSPD